MTTPSALPSPLVYEFVAQAHSNLDRVKELLTQEPALLNAAWDWGGGDWETGLGAAAHMGRKDIAEFLLGQGARSDIFAAAVLDQIEIVKALIARQPSAKNALGPHGIPLIEHAKAGGAQQVLKYLEIL